MITNNLMTFEEFCTSRQSEYSTEEILSEAYNNYLLDLDSQAHIKPKTNLMFKTYKHFCSTLQTEISLNEDELKLAYKSYIANFS